MRIIHLSTERAKSSMVMITAMCLVSLFLLSCTKSDPVIHGELEQLVEKVKQDVAPDSRVAEFSYEVLRVGDQWKITVETDQREARKKLESALSSNDNVPDVKLSIQLLPHPDLADKMYALITNSVGNIRVEPSFTAELATQALLGTPVKVLKKRDNWYRVQTPDGYLGWAEEQILRRITEDEYAEWFDDECAILISDAHITEKPDGKGRILKQAVRGSVVTITKRYGISLTVQLPDGTTGYLDTNSMLPRNEWLGNSTYSSDRIVKTAKSMLGRPYLWGGTTPLAMDCSGFTKMAYYLNGYQLPRDASQQVKAGQELTNNIEDVKSLEAGSFLFFGYKGEDGKPDRVVHVAIHLGDGSFINASGEVQIESLDPEADSFNRHRYDTFLQARSMKPMQGESRILPMELIYQSNRLLR